MTKFRVKKPFYVVVALTVVPTFSSVMLKKVKEKKHPLFETMQRGMSIVVAAGLIYATFMTLFIVPVMYDIFYRKQPRVVDVGDDLDVIPDETSELISQLKEV